MSTSMPSFARCISARGMLLVRIAKWELESELIPMPNALLIFCATAKDSLKLLVFMPTCTSSNPNNNCLASLHNAVILSKLPALMSALSHNQLPPTACIKEAAEYSPTFCPLTPPVGINLTLPNGPASAFIAGSPPYMLAGKNFKTFNPKDIASVISVGVTQPGVTATLLSAHHITSSRLNPGDTMNFAPASTHFFPCSNVRTVPAPTSIS